LSQKYFTRKEILTITNFNKTTQKKERDLFQLKIVFRRRILSEIGTFIFDIKCLKEMCLLNRILKVKMGIFDATTLALTLTILQ
jgi:hypothetical protein